MKKKMVTLHNQVAYIMDKQGAANKKLAGLKSDDKTCVELNQILSLKYS